MIKTDLKKMAKGKRALSAEVATRHSDPNFYSALTVLPNPDAVLRKLGKSHEIFDAIMADAHVIGDLRSVRSGMLRFEFRVQAGGDTPADIQAFELCEKLMQQRPTPGMRWADTVWNMAKAVLRGYQVHEIVWEKYDRFLMPAKVIDRPNRRFLFDIDNNLRLKTRSKPIEGELLADRKWLLTRHMPSHENPYGIALLSSCFWPYTFKHSGFKYFAKFCEKYGIPWAIGKLPRGSRDDDYNDLVDKLADMVEDGVAAIPDDGSVELLTAKSSGESIQERLIATCNREMSKALTSQTLASDLQGEGARAASETHRDRERDVNESDRDLICDSMCELFKWITEINVANAVPPTFEFYEEEDVQTEVATFIGKARDIVDIPKQWAYERLQIPMPQDGEEVIERRSSKPAKPNQEFSRLLSGHDFNTDDDDPDNLDLAIAQAADVADKDIADFARKAKTTLIKIEAEGGSLHDFSNALDQMYAELPHDKLAKINQEAFMLALVMGVEDAGN